MNKVYNINISKYTKSFKIRKKKYIYSSKNIEFKKGLIGLRALDSGLLSSLDFKKMYEYLKKKFKKNCIFWITKYPNIFISKKSIGVRMGKGKGKSYTNGFYIKKGTIILEVINININYYDIKKILEKYMCKLPIKTKLIKKKE